MQIVAYIGNSVLLVESKCVSKQLHYQSKDSCSADVNQINRFNGIN